MDVLASERDPRRALRSRSGQGLQTLLLAAPWRLTTWISSRWLVRRDAGILLPWRLAVRRERAERQTQHKRRERVSLPRGSRQAHERLRRDGARREPGAGSEPVAGCLETRVKQTTRFSASPINRPSICRPEGATRDTGNPYKGASARLSGTKEVREMQRRRLHLRAKAASCPSQGRARRC
jgi:hypothetical protein